MFQLTTFVTVQQQMSLFVAEATKGNTDVSFVYKHQTTSSRPPDNESAIEHHYISQCRE